MDKKKNISLIAPPNKWEARNNINLLYDATIIMNGLSKDASRSGIFFVSINILKHLLRRKDVKVSLFCHEGQITELRRAVNELLGNIKVDILTEKDFCREEKVKNIRTKGIDVYLSPVFKIPPEIKNIKTIIKYTILYDTIPIVLPEYFPVTSDWFIEMASEINEDEYFFSISEFTKKDFIKYIPRINPDNIKVVYLAASENFYNNKDKARKKDVFAKYNLPDDKKYIFSLCTLEPRKNLITAIKSFFRFIDQNEINDLVFLLGGGHWELFIKEIRKTIKEFDKYKDNTIRVGYIDDEDLSILYSFSEFFVYPSLYEGFGLPVLEAMQCGVPVITSNSSSIPEVIGDAGIMIDPKSDDELVNAFEKLYFNDNLKKKLSKKALERSKIFSWEKTVSLMVSDMAKRIKDTSAKGKVSISGCNDTKGACSYFNFEEYFKQQLFITREKLAESRTELEVTKNAQKKVLDELSSIHSSRGWKIILNIRRAVNILFPNRY